MERTEWLNRLEALHVKLREGEAVPGADRAWYEEARATLLKAAVEVQARVVASGRQLRSSIRVARPVPVQLEAGGWSAHALTIDLGTGGFAVLLEVPPAESGRLQATLALSGGPPAAMAVEVVDRREVAGLVRVALRFVDQPTGLRSRVEDAMLDGVLEQLVFWDDVLGHLEASQPPPER